MKQSVFSDSVSIPAWAMDAVKDGWSFAYAKLEGRLHTDYCDFIHRTTDKGDTVAMCKDGSWSTWKGQPYQSDEVLETRCWSEAIQDFTESIKNANDWVTSSGQEWAKENRWNNFYWLCDLQVDEKPIDVKIDKAGLAFPVEVVRLLEAMRDSDIPEFEAAFHLPPIQSLLSLARAQ